MVDFRRCITALAVLALFAGLAAAQTGVNLPLACNANVTVTPTLRGEGFTEQTGDITLTCTGGAPPINPATGATVGATVPAVNITVFYNTTVTSRLLSTSNNISEALLLIDEPGSGLPAVVTNFGPAAAQNLCLTPLTGCTQFVSQISGTPTFVATDAAGAIISPPAAPSTNKNVFQGVSNGNSVTFFGIPVLAPGTTSSRVFRMTNIRVNANALAGGTSAGTANPVLASISISGATSLLIQNPNATVGFVTNGLTATVSGAFGANQCSSQTKASTTTLRYAENFATAFKTRVAAQTNTLYNGQVSNPQQNIPGGIYNSESNFVFPAATGPNGTVAGLADYGTRLRATFSNIPAGARIFVSTANVQNNNLPVAAPSPIGGSTGNATPAAGTYAGYAQLVSGETVSDGNAGVAGFFPNVTATDNGPNNGNVPIAEIPISTTGTGLAVWEVVNTNPNTNETFSFGVYITYTSNVAQNSPLPGTSSVTLSYAPAPTAAFSASAGSAASSGLTLPRFSAGTTTASILTISICRTILLYPFVTNQAGLDTGIAIANTSQDPFTTGSNTTAAQNGTCRLTWYGGTAAAPTTPPAPTDTPSIIGGGTYTAGVINIAPGFQGYMIAVCNFQYAHGFAYISDIGNRNLAMGYLAVVLPDPGTNARQAAPGSCVVVGGTNTCSSSGEQDAH